jgi:uncharacterized membrane protein YqjE
MDANNRESAGGVSSVSATATAASGGSWLQRSVADIMQALVGNIEQIIRAEIHLASAEVSEKARRARMPAMILAAGTAISLFGAAFLLLALVYALSLTVAAWLAAFLVGAMLAVVAAILIRSGWKAFTQLAQTEPMHERTVQSVRANTQWAKAHVK